MNFVGSIEKRVLKTIKRFQLASDEDKILCAVSGGKDSTNVLYIMDKFFPNVEALTIDARIGNYSKENLENIKLFCSKLGIRLHIVSFADEFGCSLCYIQSVLKEKGLDLNSCAICGVLKRYLLNKKARNLKSDFLATGHNLDDEAQSILMNLLRGNLEMLSKLGPKSTSSVSKFVPRIKPLYLVKESESEMFCRSMGFPVQYQRCPCSVDSYRGSVRNLLASYQKTNPAASWNVVQKFLKIRKSLQANFSTQNLGYCRDCGEPSKNISCRTCTIIKTIKSKSL